VPPKERTYMAQTMFKCFTCGKVYGDEESAIKCHNAPIQRIVENERASKPRFLGN
jgi:DNA-directed RNA polymerase subunit RPC12/RpoP